ncbi:MAG: hypothetical protein UU73_C0003G0216 [Candidatus Daviesbacteria bacterium GW2011_GWA1_41_61]|uniref:Uncharacterized protein n=1 Tax=Candidatus Daviesbacteria bacterium GW2011_GWA2_40_9 TaxID=1618424 RepID=A0A0G0WHL2_9BACT|nr:MAG: hypothetical protein UU26_C0003G0010 [Candidatus Daviesbacteria bacterium GW2011_GWC1_40_9]KKR83825.1 MAG: hypothetical protein UU29_C0001G0045 [Candidatus Daviesbacteria bacterium GW2011_GWA2_40_9]KKR93434.1 MAG: hypothetical protein UU44_C0002G0095 [Candidatus Daviesbacteria bacterium GW2011_GWB1_41_15]KKS15017.1 MAG: hypothetical protein UU73_C0003G0216 [Candidatus Daviesbacteria bacterium GW2011_GWA1_41_61]
MTLFNTRVTIKLIKTIEPVAMDAKDKTMVRGSLPVFGKTAAPPAKATEAPKICPVVL